MEELKNDELVGVTFLNSRGCGWKDYLLCTVYYYYGIRYIVDEFNYLGMFNYNGKFSKTQKHASKHGRKALFSICGSLKNHSFNIETQCAVFDTYATSVLLYASDVEKVHVNFCRKS